VFSQIRNIVHSEITNTKITSFAAENLIIIPKKTELFFENEKIKICLFLSGYFSSIVPLLLSRLAILETNNNNNNKTKNTNSLKLIPILHTK
jgi:hypothetical protein